MPLTPALPIRWGEGVRRAGEGFSDNVFKSISLLLIDHWNYQVMVGAHDLPAIAQRMSHRASHHGFFGGFLAFEFADHTAIAHHQNAVRHRQHFRQV